MSMGDSGQFAPYVPPPPAAKKSPWLFVGIGCGVFLLLVFGGCGAGIFYIANKAKTDFAKPLDKAAVVSSLEDAPIYPNSKMEEKSTKAARFALGLFKGAMSRKGQSIAVAAFVTADDDSKILPWYDAKMKAAGYKAIPMKSGSAPNVNQQTMYQKGDLTVMVQIPNGSSGASYVLTRMKGMKPRGAGGNISVDVKDDSD